MRRTKKVVLTGIVYPPTRYISGFYTGDVVSGSKVLETVDVHPNDHGGFEYGHEVYCVKFHNGDWCYWSKYKNEPHPTSFPFFYEPKGANWYKIQISDPRYGGTTSAQK